MSGAQGNAMVDAEGNPAIGERLATSVLAIGSHSPPTP